MKWCPAHGLTTPTAPPPEGDVLRCGYPLISSHFPIDRCSLEVYEVEVDDLIRVQAFMRWHLGLDQSPAVAEEAVERALAEARLEKGLA